MPYTSQTNAQWVVHNYDQKSIWQFSSAHPSQTFSYVKTFKQGCLSVPFRETTDYFSSRTNCSPFHPDAFTPCTNSSVNAQPAPYSVTPKGKPAGSGFMPGTFPKATCGRRRKTSVSRGLCACRATRPAVTPINNFLVEDNWPSRQNRKSSNLSQWHFSYNDSLESAPYIFLKLVTTTVSSPCIQFQNFYFPSLLSITCQTFLQLLPVFPYLYLVNTHLLKNLTELLNTQDFLICINQTLEGSDTFLPCFRLSHLSSMICLASSEGIRSLWQTASNLSQTKILFWN